MSLNTVFLDDNLAKIAIGRDLTGIFEFEKIKLQDIVMSEIGLPNQPSFYKTSNRCKTIRKSAIDKLPTVIMQHHNRVEQGKKYEPEQERLKPYLDKNLSTTQIAKPITQLIKTLFQVHEGGFERFIKGCKTPSVGFWPSLSSSTLLNTWLAIYQVITHHINITQNSNMDTHHKLEAFIKYKYKFEDIFFDQIAQGEFPRNMQVLNFANNVRSYSDSIEILKQYCSSWKTDLPKIINDNITQFWNFENSTIKTNSK